MAYGPRTVGVAITGMLHDGTVDLECVKRCGEVAIVQDPQEAEYPSIPETTLPNVDYVVSLALMGPLLIELTADTVSNHTVRATIPVDLKHEASIAERVVGTVEEVDQIGHLVPITCPNCGRNLWELNEGKVLRYRCHTDHAFTADALLRHSQQTLENPFWVALRMLRGAQKPARRHGCPRRKPLRGAAGRTYSGNQKAHQPPARIPARRRDGSSGAMGSMPGNLTGTRH